MHLLLQLVGPFLIVSWPQKRTPKIAQKRLIRQAHPKAKTQQALYATKFAHNDLEMPSDGLVSSKTRPRWPQSGLKIVWCC